MSGHTLRGCTGHVSGHTPHFSGHGHWEDGRAGGEGGQAFGGAKKCPGTFSGKILGANSPGKLSGRAFRKQLSGQTSRKKHAGRVFRKSVPCRFSETLSGPLCMCVPVFSSSSSSSSSLPSSPGCSAGCETNGEGCLGLRCHAHEKAKKEGEPKNRGHIRGHER